MTLLDSLQSLERGDKVSVEALGESWKSPFYVVHIEERHGHLTVSLSSGGNDVTHMLQHVGGDHVQAFSVRGNGPNALYPLGRVTALEHAGRASVEKRLRMCEPDELGLSPRGERAKVGGRQ